MQTISIALADDFRTRDTLGPEKQLAAAILLQTLDDLTTARFHDDAAAFLFSSDRESVSSRERWLTLAGLPLDSLRQFETLSVPEIRERLKIAARRGQR